MANIRYSVKKISSYIIAVVLTTLIFGAASFAQNDQEMFDRARRLMDNNRFLEAYQIFAELSDYGSNLQMAPAYQYFAAKAAYHAELLEDSYREFDLLITRFPKSDYTPYGYFFLGNINYRNGKPDQAVSSYLNAFKLSEDLKLDKLLIESLEKIAADYPNAVLENIASGTITDERRCDLLVRLARGLSEGGSYQTIRSLLEQCNTPEANKIIEDAERLAKQRVEIGIILPLSGDLQKFGESILDGINLRIDEYTRETGRRLTPIVYDTRGDDLEAGRIVRRLASSGAAAAIGPLTSEEASISSAVLSCGDMPLIIPAASQAGLTELSSTSFQLRPNLEWQGIKMADFAIQKLGADTAAILSPTAPENLMMARAFERRFKYMGGTVLGVEYFRTTETDFGPYVKDLKSQLISALNDSLDFIDEDGDTIDAEEVPAWVDCLYIPADPGQLRMLLPQIDFYNLSTIYLGGDGWGSETIYNLGDRITKTNYFTSGRMESSVNATAQKLLADFDLKYGRRPGFLERLGYDAMGLIIKALNAGQFSRAEITHYLSTIHGYQGASGDVSFGENRENIELPVYTIVDGYPNEVKPEDVTGQ